MKKVIDGKRYDTKTATYIGQWENGPDTHNFDYCSETLYRTPKGAYFLFGEGHARSKYGESYGDSMCWGKAIVPLSADEAFEWAQTHLQSDVTEEHFADRVEDA